MTLADWSARSLVWVIDFLTFVARAFACAPSAKFGPHPGVADISFCMASSP
jgi:hypothetical protein